MHFYLWFIGKWKLRSGKLNSHLANLLMECDRDGITAQLQQACLSLMSTLESGRLQLGIVVPPLVLRSHSSVSMMQQLNAELVCNIPLLGIFENDL